MPFNEFVCYRKSIRPDDEQSVIVCSRHIPDSIKIPDGLHVYLVGRNAAEISRVMRKIKSKCYKQGIKLVIHLHQPTSATIFFLSTAIHNYRRSTVFTVHSLFSAYSLKNKILSAFSTLMAAQVTCVSQASFDSLPDWIKKIKNGTIRVLMNGVDLERIDRVCTNDAQPASDIKTMIYVARMIPLKNHRFLIEVLSKMDNGRLILVGAEDNDGEIRELIAYHHLEDRVEFTGLIPRDDVYERLAQADIYVSPSRVEGLPVSVLEAMNAGLPVIISDIAPHMEIARLCPAVVTIPLELQRWIEELKHFQGLDRASMQKIGASCRRYAQKEFSLDSMLRQYDNIYEEL